MRFRFLQSLFTTAPTQAGKFDKDLMLRAIERVVDGTEQLEQISLTLDHMNTKVPPQLTPGREHPDVRRDGAGRRASAHRPVHPLSQPRTPPATRLSRGGAPVSLMGWLRRRRAEPSYD